jgi:hypothetical protein
LKRQLHVLGTVVTGLTLAAAMNLAVVPSASAGAPAPVHSTASAFNVMKLATESPLGMLPETIDRFGETRLGSIYTGLAMTRNRTHIDVFLTSLDPAAEEALRALSPSGVLSFFKASHSRRQLLTIHQQVTREAEHLAALGIRLVRWFPRINQDAVEDIGVLNLTPARARLLRQLFGASNIALSNIPKNDLPVATASRDDDFSPWSGGDFITSHDIGCTSGVGLVYGGNTYMLTAAHCYEDGWSIYNALFGAPGTDMGTQASRDTSYGGDDTALLSMTPSKYIWTGNPTSSADTQVTGSADSPQYDTVCNEGAYSGQVCSEVQGYLPGCISLSGVTGFSGPRYECNLVWAAATNPGQALASETGDSGAAVIRYLNGGAEVTGIVSGGETEVPCTYSYGGHNGQVLTSCYSTLFYTSMPEILSTEYPGAAIYTG